MGVRQSVCKIVIAVDPLSLIVGQASVTNQVSGQLGEALAPLPGKFVVNDALPAAERLSGGGHLDGKRPRRVAGGRRAVVQQNLIAVGELFRPHVAAVGRPDPMIGRASELGAVSEAETNDRT